MTGEEEDWYESKVHEQRARIAKLTTEVADLKSKLDFANAMNADQDKEVAELTAEVVSLREALNAIDVIACLDRSHPVISTLARNALKDG